MTLFYLVSFLIGALAFLLFVAGKAIGGALDHGGGPLPPEAPFTQRIGRWINNLGDNAQVVGATTLIVVAGIAALVSGFEWYNEGKRGVILVFCLLVVANVLFYLAADEPERKKRSLFTSLVITLGAVGVVLVNVGFANNNVWFPVKVIMITIGDQPEEPFIPTPNGTVVSVPELFGPAWPTYLVKDEIKNCGALNVSSGNFELREENGACEMRSTRLGFRRGDLARGEYASPKAFLAARQGKAEAPADEVQKPGLSKKTRHLMLGGGFILLGILLMLLRHLMKKGEASGEHKPDEKPAASKAATPAPATPAASHGGH